MNQAKVFVLSLGLLVVSLMGSTVVFAVTATSAVSPVANVAEFVPLGANPTLELNLPPPPTCSGANCPDLSIKNAEIRTFDGNHVSVHVFCSRIGSSQVQAKLQVHAKVGDGFTKVYEAPIRADGSGSGFDNTAGFDINPETTELFLKIVTGVHERNYENNRVTLAVPQVDLVFNSSVTEEKVGGHPNRLLHLEIQNNGPDALLAQKCHLSVVLKNQAGQQVGPNIASMGIPAMPRRAKYPRVIPFQYPDVKAFTATIVCDPSAHEFSHNNSQDGNTHN